MCRAVAGYKYPCLNGQSGSDQSKQFTVSITLTVCRNDYANAVRRVEDGQLVQKKAMRNAVCWDTKVSSLKPYNPPRYNREQTLHVLTKDLGTSVENATNAQQDALNKCIKYFHDHPLVDGCDVTLKKEAGGLRGSWDIKLYIRQEQVKREEGVDNTANYAINSGISAVGKMFGF